MRVALVTTVLALGTTAGVAAQPQVAIHGDPYFDGNMALSITAEESVGKLVWLGVGLNPLPLDAPVQTGKGPWYVGTLTHSLVLGAVPGNGRLDLPFTMPSEVPAVVGTHIVVQSLVDGVLSNPATIPLDQPHHLAAEAQVLASPNPSLKAQFGSHTAAGDLNGDGDLDLVVAAHQEDFGGIDKSGRVYVLWGPDYASSTALSPPVPVEAGFFGASVTVADLDAVAPDDLLIGETAGDPTPPSNPAKVHVYYGSQTFPTTPSVTIASPGTGTEYVGYGAYVTTGDYNNDTHRDVAVGHNRATVSGVTKAGRIDIFLGPDFLSRLEVPSPQPQVDGAFGSRVATADVNGDTIDDLIESSPVTDEGGVSNVGSAHVFVGPALTLTQTIPCPEPLGPSTRFGETLAVGELNGDLINEILIADTQDRVFVFWSPNYTDFLLAPKPPALQQNPFGETAYGRALATADINADGLTDLIIGNPFEGDEQGCIASGGGRVFGALAPYFATFHRVVDSAPACGDEFGTSIVPLLMPGGSVSLLVGALFADDGGLASSGHVTLLSGTAAPAGAPSQ